MSDAEDQAVRRAAKEFAAAMTRLDESITQTVAAAGKLAGIMDQAEGQPLEGGPRFHNCSFAIHDLVGGRDQLLAVFNGR